MLLTTTKQHRHRKYSTHTNLIYSYIRKGWPLPGPWSGEALGQLVVQEAGRRGARAQTAAQFAQNRQPHRYSRGTDTTRPVHVRATEVQTSLLAHCSTPLWQIWGRKRKSLSPLEGDVPNTADWVDWPKDTAPYQNLTQWVQAREDLVGRGYGGWIDTCRLQPAHTGSILNVRALLYFVIIQ